MTDMADQADIGLIGLGVMGRNLVLNMDDHGYRVAVFNRTIERVDEFLADEAAGTNVIGTHSLEELVASLGRPRKILLMITAGKPVEDQIDALFPMLDRGDIIIDGGNSLYSDTERRVAELAEHGIHFVGMGISGGEEGARYGPSIMPGGSEAAWPLIKDLVQDIAADAEGEPCGDWMGSGGAGHFVKMIHNGIEYGLMAAYAEGLNILKKANIGKADRDVDAETTPLRQPEHYQYDFNLADVTELWRRGSVVTSWLLDLTAGALAGNPALDNFAGRVSDSGEGRWTVAAANDEAVPAHVLTSALYERFASRDEDDFQNRVLSAMRFGFGGHVEKK